MHRRDEAGTMHVRSITGRGFGFGASENAVGYRARFGPGAGIGMDCRCGYGMRYGFGRRAATNDVFEKTQKDLLQEQKNVLQSRIHAIDKQIVSL